jgi:hypothetical protein
MTVQPPGQPPEDLTAQWQQWTVPGTTVPAVPAVAGAVAAAAAADALVDGPFEGDPTDGPDADEDMNAFLTQKFAEEGAINAATQAQWDTFNGWS